ncbi:MAG TPA: hypothetical protein VGY53_02575 [Isosphaeraceae bacterium]|nr:hypothetical protein [Isosphaeraceae bacterium]
MSISKSWALGVLLACVVSIDATAQNSPAPGTLTPAQNARVRRAYRAYGQSPYVRQRRHRRRYPRVQVPVQPGAGSVLPF